MRGLTLFITDLKKCTSKEEELKVINKELANIRSKFKGDKLLNGYQKRKYICKLVLVFLLGYKCNLGQIEAVNLLSSNAYSDKQAGYLFISVVKDDKFNHMPLVLNALKNDLSSSSIVFRNLALQFIANNSSAILANSMADPVIKELFSGETEDFVKQTALLALLQILRTKSDMILAESAMNILLNLILHHNLGIVTASASVVEFLVKKFPSQCECCVKNCTVKLSKLVSHSCLDIRDYSYYSVVAPWICVKLLRILQNFSPPSEASVKARLTDALDKILRKVDETPKTKIFEHNNAKYAVIFEAISLIVHMGFDGTVLCRSFSILGATLQRKEPNLRSMALEMMARLSSNNVYLERVKSYWSSVLKFLVSEPDVAMKIRAVDLLYTLCSEHSVKDIVHEMLNLLKCDLHFPDDVMIKTAAMAEQFCNDREWYVDTVFNLLQIRGDRINDNVWHSLVKIIIEDDSIQEYAARVSYTVSLGRKCNDTVIKLAGYILGEFGYLIASDPQSSYKKQFNALEEKYLKCSPSTKALLLTTFMKLYNCCPAIKKEVQLVFKSASNIQSENTEIQQRAVEYLKLTEIASPSLLATVFDAMPSSKLKVSATLAAIENKKIQKFYIRRTDKRPRRKNLTKFKSHPNLKTVVQNSNKIRVRKSASHSDLTQATSGYSNVLVDIFKDVPFNNTITETASGVSSSSVSSSVFGQFLKPRTSNILNNQSFLQTMLFNEKAKLYEDDVILIDIESEFNKHWGRFHLKYTNKTATDFSRFSIQEDFVNILNKCSVRFKLHNTELPANGIVEQYIYLECLSVFSEKPSLNLKFISNNQHHHEVKLVLPLTLNKFVEPAHMTPDDFIKRWQTFEYHNLEVTKEFPAQYPMIYGVTRQKLKGFRLGVIEKVNSESEHFHCAGIFYTREERVGFLIQLERHILDNMYCSRVRSSQTSISHVISNLLCELL